MANAIKNDLKELSLLGAFAALGIAYSCWQAPEHWPHQFQTLAGDEITYQNAQGLQPIWVDVRSTEAFRIDALPGALHLNSNNWEAQLLTRFALTIQPIIVCHRPCKSHEIR